MGITKLIAILLIAYGIRVLVVKLKSSGETSKMGFGGSKKTSAQGAESHDVSDGEYKDVHKS